MIDRARCQVKSGEKIGRLSLCLLFAATALLLLPSQAHAQTTSTEPANTSSASVISPVGSENQYSWIESYDGSFNALGDVMVLDSSAGYNFGPHTYVGGGIPIYCVRATTTTSTGTSTSNSFTALGDLYGLVRFSFLNPALNFKTQITGRAPTGSTSNGISTGHATYDWTNRFDHALGPWTPFFEVGLADSIPDAFIYRRPFASYGTLAHFQAGTEYQIVDWLGVAASGFDIAPWGSQTLDSRVAGNGAAASGGHGRPFQNEQKVTGGSTLTADNGFATAVVFSPGKAADFTLGYSRSTHYDLNTFSFGVTLNMRELLRRSSL